MGAGTRGRSIQIRGVDDKFTSVMPGFHIIQGRMFRTGLNEMIVGVND